MTDPGLAVLADTRSPGWYATLDGAPAPILRANIVQRAVLIPGSASPAVHTLRFLYRPEDFLFGLYVSLLTLAAVTAFWLASSTGGAARSRKGLLL
jgi:hypothetical protein